MENANPLVNDSTPTGWYPGKLIRKARRSEKRYANQVERARIREDLQAGMRDPEIFLDLASEWKNTRKLLASGAAHRRELLDVQKRKVQAELRNTRDLDTFILKTSRSRTLFALIAMGFFRRVLDSDEYREDHRYKQAIRKAMEEPGLCKAIQRKWVNFDRQFPDRTQKHSW
jgi:hypothetical protein